MAQKTNETEAVGVIDNAQPATSEPPIDVVAAATAQAESWQQHERQERDEDARGQWAAYSAIIIRRPNPKPTDAADLANVMRDLGIDAARVRADLKLIAEARALQRLHEQRQAAIQAASEAVAELDALERRHRQEHAAADLKRVHTKNHSEVCNEAAYQLVKLSRQRPALFDCSTEPPRLLGDS